MTTTYEQVEARENVILRHAGSASAAIIGIVRKYAQINVDGPVNANGYVPVHVDGHKDGPYLLADSFSMPDKGVSVVAELYQGAIFEPLRKRDEFGRTFGTVKGYVAHRWTMPIKPDAPSGQ